MEFKLADEPTIIDGLCNLNCEIYRPEDVRSFLITNTLNKKVADRFVSWLIQLRILTIRRSQWGTDLYKMNENYFERCTHYFSRKPQDPLATISMQFESAIRPDLEELSPWLKSFLVDAGLTRTEAARFDLRVARMYALLASEAQGFSYTKGLLRMGCVCIAMTAGFAKCAKLPFDFAEATAYYLTKNVISIIPMRRMIDDRKRLMEHFDNIDQMIRCLAPETYERLRLSGSGSFYFGLRYEMFFYAQEHSAVAVMNIWDQIFGRLEQLTEFIQCLTVAHAMQVRIPDGCKDATAAVLATEKWDLTKLIDDARMILTHQRSCGESFCLYFCPKLSRFHGYEIKTEWF